MDLSAIIVVIGGTALFFGFIGLMAIYSRRKNREKMLLNRREIDFSKIRKKNEQFFKFNAGDPR